jgi:hypothetical protein
MKKPVPFIYRLIIFALWPLIASVMLCGVVILLVVAWPFTLTSKLTYKINK